MSEFDQVGSLFIKDLKDGDSVLQFFLVKAKDTKKTRSGNDYLDLSLEDCTGLISAKMWSDTLKKWGQDFKSGDCVKVSGRVEAYKDRNQIIIERIRKADLSEVPDQDGLIRSSGLDCEELFAKLITLAESLNPKTLSEFVVFILQSRAESLKYWPAARMVHHAYRGGLLEHVWSVVQKVETICALEKRINRHVSVAGAILHDIGKTVELDAVGGRTPEGRLLGHLVIGLDLLRDAAIKREVTEECWFAEIQHILLSHHGHAEFGSPTRPMTREAILVHYMDDLDAKLKIIDEALGSVDSEGFSPYNKWLQTRAYIGSMPVKEEEDYD